MGSPTRSEEKIISFRIIFQERNRAWFRKLIESFKRIWWEQIFKFYIDQRKMGKISRNITSQYIQNLYSSDCILLKFPLLMNAEDNIKLFSGSICCL